MNTINESYLDMYLNFCRYQKKLNQKTIRAYRIDLYQLLSSLDEKCCLKNTPQDIENYIQLLHQKYKPKTI